jgi:hypothetical protein
MIHEQIAHDAFPIPAHRVGESSKHPHTDDEHQGLRANGMSLKEGLEPSENKDRKSEKNSAKRTVLDPNPVLGVLTSDLPEEDLETLDAKNLRERCKALQARERARGVLLLELKSDMDGYEDCVHEALIQLGVEEGHHGLSVGGAGEQLKKCISILQESETHLLAQMESMNATILQQKNLESAIMTKLHAFISKEQALASLQGDGKAEAELQETLTQKDEELSQKDEELSQKDEELRQLYTYSTELLQRICSVEEENERLCNDEAQKDAQVANSTGLANPVMHAGLMSIDDHKALLKTQEDAWQVLLV